MRFESHHATGHAAVARFVDQQRDHGLVAPVNPVKIADGHRATFGGGERLDGGGSPQASDDFHASVGGDGRQPRGLSQKRCILTHRAAPIEQGSRMEDILSVCWCSTGRWVLKVLTLSAQELPQLWTALEEAVLHLVLEHAQLDQGFAVREGTPAIAQLSQAQKAQ